MGNEIMSYERASLAERQQYAETMAYSPLLPSGLKSGPSTPANVLLVMESGSMLGIHPIAALQGVNIIEGRPTLSPALMSAVVRRAGHKLRVTTSGSIAGGDFEAKAVLVRADDPDHPFEVVWNVERAIRAKLIDKYEQRNGVWSVTALRGRNNNPSPWQLYTEAMMKARAISEVSREGATDVLMGLGYVPEELGADVDELGEVVATTEAAPSEPTPASGGRQKREKPTEETDSSPIDSPQPPQEVIDQWVAAADATTEYDRLRELYQQAQSGGMLGVVIETNQGTGQVLTLGDYLTAKGMAAKSAAEQPVQRGPEPSDDNVVDAEVVTDDEPPMAMQ